MTFRKSGGSIVLLSCTLDIINNLSGRHTASQNVSSIYMLLKDTFVLFSLLSIWLLLLGSPGATAAPLHTIDFSGHPDGPAEEWLKQQGFTFHLDADDLQPHFKGNRLVLHTARKKAGLFEFAPACARQSSGFVFIGESNATRAGRIGARGLPRFLLR